MTSDNFVNRVEISGGKVQGFIQENHGTVTQNFITQVSELVSGQVSVVDKELTREQYRQRAVLLSKVKDYWIKGVLEKSLYAEAMIELSIEERSDLVERPFTGFEEIPEESKESFSTGIDATEFFDQIGDGRTLLILGEPGSGKTITLLKLAQNLIACAEEDVNRSIPVVFSLSSWRIKRQTIADWLLDELLSKYGVPKAIGKDWVEQQKLILLLDSLDEVKTEDREACVQAINQFMEHNGQTEVVVCSRIEEYEALSAHLRLRGSVFIRPLTPEQINQYLNRAGEQLQAVKTLLQEDTALQDLAKSPLTLNVMTLAYQGKKVEELPQTGSVEERRQHLFDSYIKRMFSQEKVGKPREYKSPYQNLQTILWLSWLAQCMTKESQTVFLIENLQPQWLKTNSQKLFYILAVPLFIFLVFSVLNFFIGLPVIKNYYSEQVTIGYLSNDLSRSATSSYFSFLTMIFFYFLYSFAMGWKLIINEPFFLCKWIKNLANNKFSKNSLLVKHLVPLGDLFKLYYRLLLSNYLVPDVEPIEAVTWSLSIAAKTLRKNLIALLILGIITAAISIFVGVIVYFNQINLHQIDLFSIFLGLLGVLIFSLIFCLFFILFFVICFGPFVFVLGGINIETSVKKTMFPNQGIWKSAKNIVVLSLLGVFLGVSFTIPVMLPSVLMPVGIEQKPTLTMPELSFLTYIMLTMAIPLALLAGGACIKHVVLRIIFYFNGYIPWNYAFFLNYASDRIFLRKVGGSYIFIHRTLQEHFARMNSI